MSSLPAQHEVTGRQCHTQIFPWGLSICGALMFMLLYLKGRTISPASLFFSLRKTPSSHSKLQTGHWCAFWLYSAPICTSYCPLLRPLGIFILMLSVDFLGLGVLVEAREESVQSVQSRALRYFSKDYAHSISSPWQSLWCLSKDDTYTHLGRFR